MVTFPL